MQKPIPDYLKEVPTPQGIIVNPIEDKLDRLQSACIGVLARGISEHCNIAAEYTAFTPKERELLNASRIFWSMTCWAGVYRFTKSIFAARRYERLIFPLIHALGKMRTDLMLRNMKRPPHRNPPTLLIAR